jgi:MFS family permease
VRDPSPVDVGAEPPRVDQRRQPGHGVLAARVVVNRTAGTPVDIARAGALRPILVAASTTALGVLPVFLLGGLSVLMAPELGFDNRGLGFAVSAFFGVSALAASPAGRFGDAVGPRRAMRIGVALSVSCLVGIGLLARSWWILVGFLAVGGVGNSLSQMAGNVLLVATTPIRRRGIAFASKQAAVPFANFAAGAAVPLLGLTIGWRWAFPLTALLASVLLVRMPVVSAQGGRSRNASIHRSALLLLAAAGTLSAGAGNAAAAFLVPALTDGGTPVSTAGLLLGLGGAAGIASRLGAGLALDRFRFDGFHGAAALVAVGALGFVALARQPNSLALLVLATVMVFGAGWGWAGLFTFAVAQSNPDAAGRATGITQAGIFTGGVLGPSLFGVVVEAAGYPAGWLVSAGLACVGVCCLLAGGRLLRRGPSTRRRPAR